jgi:hypothetical protein
MSMVLAADPSFVAVHMNCLVLIIIESPLANSFGLYFKRVMIVNDTSRIVSE